MKKTSRFFALVLAIGLIPVMLASCTKTPSDSNTFKAIAQEKGYTIEDALAQFSNYPEFKEVFIAYPSGHPFQIELMGAPGLGRVYEEARKYSDRLLRNARRITLELDPASPDHDKFERLLAWVWVDNDLLQGKLVENKHACERSQQTLQRRALQNPEERSKKAF